MKKIVSICILFLGLTLNVSGQSDKMKEKAIEWVNELNTEITSVDKSLSLTDAQKGKIQTIQIERMMALKKAKDEGASDKVNKEINKTYYQKIFKDVLTQNQMKARKTAKEK